MGRVFRCFPRQIAAYHRPKSRNASDVFRNLLCLGRPNIRIKNSRRVSICEPNWPSLTRNNLWSSWTCSDCLKVNQSSLFLRIWNDHAWYSLLVCSKDTVTVFCDVLNMYYPSSVGPHAETMGYLLWRYALKETCGWLLRAVKQTRMCLMIPCHECCLISWTDTVASPLVLFS